jgi:hypothetical protein
MKKTAVFVITFTLFFSTISAKESSTFLHQIKPYFTMEPVFILNTADQTTSAPSPIVYPLSIGLIWPDTGLISFQPRLSFFTCYYLWDNSSERALPAEVENRTATSLSFLVDMPVVFSFNINKISTAELSAGISFLMRAALLSNGVSSSDSGTSGSAESDVELINEWFWQKARFLYVETGGGWLFKCTDKIKAGPEVRFYLPVGSLADGHGMDAMMVSAGLKIIF